MTSKNRGGLGEGRGGKQQHYLWFSKFIMFVNKCFVFAGLGNKQINDIRKENIKECQL